MNNRFRDKKGRNTRQENLANLEEAMQKEREPVGEHFLGYGLRSAKDRGSMLTVCKSFLFHYCLHGLACLAIFLILFSFLELEIRQTRLAYSVRKNNRSKILEKVVGITSVLSGNFPS